jgi:hypothetical protein
LESEASRSEPSLLRRIPLIPPRPAKPDAAPEVDPPSAGPLGALQKESDPIAEKRARAGKSLEDIVKRYLTPPLSDPSESVKSTHVGALVANLLPEQHAWLEAFLTTQRTYVGFISVDADLFTVPRGALRSLGIESTAVVLNPADRDVFVQRLREEANVQSITAPKVTVLPNQRANVSVLNQVAYVQDWTIEIVEPNRQEIADPHIAVINEGVVLDLRATPTAANELGLELTLTNSELKRPIQTVKTRLSTSTPRDVEIGLPEVSTIRIATTTRIADGASVVLSTPGSGDTDLVLVLRARQVTTVEHVEFGPEGVDRR